MPCLWFLPVFNVVVPGYCYLVLIAQCPLQWKGGAGSIIWATMEDSFRVEWWLYNGCCIHKLQVATGYTNNQKVPQSEWPSLLDCFQETKHVILVFSVQGSGHFQGNNFGDKRLLCLMVLFYKIQHWQFFIIYCPPATGFAQMTSPIGKDKSPEFGSTSLSGVFSVEWIKKYYDLLFIFKLSLRGKQTQWYILL